MQNFNRSKALILIIMSFGMLFNVNIQSVGSENEDEEQTLLLYFVAPLNYYASPFTTTNNFVWLTIMNTVGASLYTRYSSSRNGIDEFRPQLAHGLPIVSEDGKNFTIKIKEGLKFSTGNNLTAEDIAFSYFLYASPSTSLVKYLDYGPKLESNVTMIDDLTIQFSFKEASFVNYNLLVNSPIIEKTDVKVEKYNNCVSGNQRDCEYDFSGRGYYESAGPMKIDVIDQLNHRYELIRNPYYFGEPSWAERLIIQGNVEYNPIAEIAKQEADAVFMSTVGIPIPDGNRYRKFDMAHTQSDTISLNMLHPIYGTGEMIPDGESAVSPTDSIQASYVRKAISFALDRDYMIQLYEGGKRQYANLSPAEYGLNLSAEADYHSIELAKQYMQDAGFDYSTIIDSNNDGDYTDPGDTTFFNFSIIINDGSGWEFDRKFLFDAKVQLSKIGIEFDVLIVDQYEKRDRAWGWGENTMVPLYSEGGFDSVFVFWYWPIPMDFAKFYLEEGFCSNRVSLNEPCDNFINYKNPVLETLVYEVIDEASNVTHRAELITQIEKILHDDRAHIPLIEQASIIVVDKDLHMPDSKYADSHQMSWEEAYYDGWVRHSENYNNEEGNNLITISLIAAVVIILMVIFVRTKRRSI